MVHVLREVHKALRPTGVLLDLHPLPRHPCVEVWSGGRRVRLGSLDDAVGIQVTRAAREHLAAVVGAGYFRIEARRWFDQLTHYSNVDDWLQRRVEYGTSSIIPPDLLQRVHEEMDASRAELVLVERIRATRMKRVDQT